MSRRTPKRSQMDLNRVRLNSQWDQEMCRIFPHDLSSSWVMVNAMVNGGQWRHDSGLRVTASVNREYDGRRWLRLSCFRENRHPNWLELNEVRSQFAGEMRAISVLSSQSFDSNPYVIHMFVCLDGDPIPKFWKTY